MVISMFRGLELAMSLRGSIQMHDKNNPAVIPVLESPAGSRIDTSGFCHTKAPSY